MASSPGYAQPDPRNPFINPQQPQQYPQYPQQYQQRRRDYDADSDLSDPYGSRNGSTAFLASTSHHHDPSGQSDSHREHHSPSILTSLSYSRDASPLHAILLPGFFLPSHHQCSFVTQVFLF